MKNYVLIIVFLLITFVSKGQIKSQNVEQFPIFPACESLSSKELETCFYSQIQNFIYNNYKVPEELVQIQYRGNCIVLFEVNDQGEFNVLYVDGNEKSLNDECKRVFGLFPKIKPPTYNGKPTYTKYTIQIAIPLVNPTEVTNSNLIAPKDPIEVKKDKEKEAALKEYDSIVYHKFNNPKFESTLNIPLSHSYYAQFDAGMNQVGTNNHTASKPFTYAEVAKYYNLRAENDKIMKPKTSWGGRKLWNENLVQLQGEGYWFTLNAIFDLQVGASTPSDFDTTFLNTRALQIQGGIGKEVTFTTTLYESQGRYADYFNEYAIALKPSGGNPATVPGIGIAKQYKEDAFDMPLAESNITFAPGKVFNFQLGYGRNFIGDGYRSLLMTDGVSPYPYFKINTTFWKIKYTNVYTWLKDVRKEVTIDGTYATKYMSNHYLSWNASKKLNFGLFESVVWSDANDRGFDMAFINPIIFYRAVEFSSSSKTGNALLGLTFKYKWNNHVNVYGQFLLDEFSTEEVSNNNQSWKNKYAYQLGVKYFNAFNVQNLLLQLEYNAVRPYMYSHSLVISNYGNVNQSMGHQWGANLREAILIGHYFKGRYFADGKLTYGQRGFDYNTESDTYNYGGNIYRSYDDQRPYDSGVKIGQGNTTNIFVADFQAGYLVNPQINMKFFVSYLYRNFKPTVDTEKVYTQSTSWISVGLRCDIFNMYYDY
ncbi:MAG TPA: hypothetical protein VN192_06365 [Flavobacterium sp.]|jgi:hypothetical protein|nr:hypothetical protein [Flavobacterium sp.]